MVLFLGGCMWDEFKKFLLRGNVVDLAVAVIVGAAFNKIVTSVVADVVTPLIGLIRKCTGLFCY